MRRLEVGRGKEEEEAARHVADEDQAEQELRRAAGEPGSAGAGGWGARSSVSVGTAACARAGGAFRTLRTGMKENSRSSYLANRCDIRTRRMSFRILRARRGLDGWAELCRAGNAAGRARAQGRVAGARGRPEQAEELEQLEEGGPLPAGCDVLVAAAEGDRAVERALRDVEDDIHRDTGQDVEHKPEGGTELMIIMKAGHN